VKAVVTRISRRVAVGLVIVLPDEERIPTAACRRERVTFS
jgi:hypothetical protein